MSIAPASTRFLLWVDAVGGFLVCHAPRLRIGQAVPGNAVELPILADLSRHHATIERVGEAYVIEPLHEVRLAGQPISARSSLTHGAVLEMGRALQLRFEQPHPLSASARLEILSRHRTQPAATSILLMAETLVLGNSPRAHVFCPRWSSEVVLARQHGQLICRTGGRFNVCGKTCESRAALPAQAQIRGADFSLSIEEC